MSRWSRGIQWFKSKVRVVDRAVVRVGRVVVLATAAAPGVRAAASAAVLAVGEAARVAASEPAVDAGASEMIGVARAAAGVGSAMTAA